MITRKLWFGFLIACMVLLGGCQNDRSQQRPYLMGSAPTSGPQAYNNERTEQVRISGETEKEVARIQAERDVELKKIEQETVLKQADVQREIEREKNEVQKTGIAESYSFMHKAMIVLAVFGVLVLLLILYFLHKRRQDNLRMHRDTIEKEMALKERELQVKMAEKMLDAIASGNLNDEQSARLVESFTRTSNRVTHLEG